jgi:hypothetical protein
LLRELLTKETPDDARRTLVALADCTTVAAFEDVIVAACTCGAWLEIELLHFVASMHQRGVSIRDTVLDDVLDVIVDTIAPDFDG